MTPSPGEFQRPPTNDAPTARRSKRPRESIFGEAIKGQPRDALPISIDAEAVHACERRHAPCSPRLAADQARAGGIFSATHSAALTDNHVLPESAMPSSRTHPTRAKTSTASASELIDAKIAGLADWRGEMLSRLRALIKAADPDVIEEWKWSIPVWSHDGLICTGETYKKVVKTTFAKGASLPDPSRLFNSSLEGNTRRAIDFHEGDEPDEPALKALVRAAVAFNKSSSRG